MRASELNYVHFHNWAQRLNSEMSCFVLHQYKNRRIEVQSQLRKISFHTHWYFSNKYCTVQRLKSLSRIVWLDRHSVKCMLSTSDISKTGSQFIMKQHYQQRKLSTYSKFVYLQGILPNKQQKIVFFVRIGREKASTGFWWWGFKNLFGKFETKLE